MKRWLTAGIAALLLSGAPMATSHAAPAPRPPARAAAVTGPWVFLSEFPPVSIFGNANLFQSGGLVVGAEWIHGRKVTGFVSGKTILLVFTDPLEGTYYFLGTVSGSTMAGLAVHNGVQSPWQAVRGSLAGAL